MKEKFSLEIGEQFYKNFYLLKKETNKIYKNY